MKWYEERFVNRRDWVLDHLELLNLSVQEAMCVLLIDFMNDNQMDISIDALAAKTGMKKEEVDQTISVLCAKKYLEIRASSRNVRFILDGLFATDTAKDRRIIDTPLFDVFETSFGRPLSPQEMTKISDWNQTTDRRLIVYALREACAYQKKNLSYVEAILTGWIKKGYTAEMIEEGNVYEG